MFLVKVYRRVDNMQMPGTEEGQGFYKYKTFRNFVRYVIDNPKHVLYNVCRGSEYYIKVFKCTEETKDSPEEELELVLDGKNVIYTG